MYQESRNSHVFTCAKFRKCRPLESPLFKLHPQQLQCHLSHGSQHMLLDLNKITAAGRNPGCAPVDCFLEQQCSFLLIDSSLGGFYPTKELDKPSALSPVYENPDQKAQNHKKNMSEGITLRIYAQSFSQRHNNCEQVQGELGMRRKHEQHVEKSIVFPDLL